MPAKQFQPLQDSVAVLPLLSHTSFLGGIVEEKQELVLRHFETARYEGGEYIARKGEEPTHIYIIKQGRVELRLGDAARSLTKRVFHAGDCFGEAAMLSLVNNTASFLAVEPPELIVFSRRALNQLRREAPDVFCQLILNLARDLARKLQYTDEMLLRERTRPAGE